MPDPADLHPLLWTLLISGAAAGALVALQRAAVRIVVPVWKRIRAIHELVEGELSPNGGKSMKDVVCRIEAKLDVLDSRVTRLEDDR